MKIVVQKIDASDDDCIRYDFVTMVDGKEHLLSPSSREHSVYTVRDIILTARGLFGPYVEIDWSESFGTLNPYVIEGIGLANQVSPPLESVEDRLPRIEEIEAQWGPFYK